MKNLISSLLFIISFFTVGAASAYTHTRELPSDFHPSKCNYDKDLIKYKSWFVNDVLQIPETAQVVSYSHNSIIYNNEEHLVPDGPKFAYNYMCTFKNNQGISRHIWSSYVLVDANGKRIRTYVLVPSSHKKQLIYKGKTYSNWMAWYADKFFDDDGVDEKYKNFDKLEVFNYYKRGIIKSHVRDFEYVPMYKFRYVGSINIGDKKFHTWETFLNSNYNSKVWIYTQKPNPPLFEDRFKWVDKSKGLY